MVATRSMRPKGSEGPLPRQSMVNESPKFKATSTPMARRNKNQPPEEMKDPKPDGVSDAEAWLPLQDPPTVKATKRRSRASLAQIIEPATDGDVSEAESVCSYASGLQEPTVRVTRRRRIIIPCQPESKTRARHKSVRSGSIKSGDEGEVSEAESWSSALSSLLSSPVRTRNARQRESKFLLDPNSLLLAEETSDAESWCSGVSSIGSRKTRQRLRRSKKEALTPQAQVEDKNRPENANQSELAFPFQLESILESPCMNSQNSDTERTAPSPGNRPNECKAEVKVFDEKSLVKSSEEKPEVQTSKKGAIAKESLEGKNLNKEPCILEKEEETSCEELKQSNFEIQFTSQSQSIPDKTKPEEEKPGADKEKKAFALSVECKPENKQNEKAEEISEETSCEELKQSNFEKQFTSQSQSIPDKTKPEEEKPGADKEKKAFALSVECKPENKQTETAEEISDVTEITDNNDVTEITGNENSDCKIGVVEDFDDKKEHLKDNTWMSPASVSNRSQENSDSILLALSSDEDQVSDNSESEEDTLCIDSSEQKLSSEKDPEDNQSNDVFFVIDKAPGLSSDKNYYIEEEKTSEKNYYIEEEKTSEVASEQENEEESEEEELVDQEENEEEFIDEDDLLSNTKSNLLKLSSSSIDPGLNIKQLGGLYINFNAEKMDFNKNTLTEIKEKNKNELLQKSIITPDFEKKDCIPPYKESQFQLKKKRREERKKTAGDGWFGMKAPELTTELKNDLKALQMRASMNPKRFYKKNDRDGFPKYFQVGTIADNPADFYHSRIPKKQRKRTIVEELLADSEFRRYNKRKYTEIMMEKASNAAGKKFQKKKKFRN